MKMQDDVEPFVPRAPKHHALFGERFIRNHFFIDSKWTPGSRVAEYRCMVDVLEKNRAFNNAQSLGNRRKQSRALNSLKKECSDGRTKLKIALFGDTQRIRNILRKHKELSRLYQNMPFPMVADNINQRTFVKRKEHDRLTFQKNCMTKRYKEALLELSKLQERVKYQNEFILPEETAANEYRMELKNSETRLRALKTVTRAYSAIRQALYQDAIYYGPVLNSLEDDINEQANFINKVIHLGRPALGKVAILVNEYDIMEEQTRKSMQERLATLLAARQKTASNSAEVKKLVRKDSDFEIFPNRYDRETSSMTNLKKNLEDIEKVMKQVKQVTLCARAREVYPRMKKQIRHNQQLKERLEMTRLEKDFLEDKDQRAKHLIESLKYNVTDESNERKEKIHELKDRILEEKKRQDDMSTHMKERGEVMAYLRFSINQIVDTLRHVSDGLGVTRREYPNPDLKLPLLQFINFTPQAFPPAPFEHNPEKLLRGIKDRVLLLMKVYQQKKNDQEVSEATKEYHRAYLRSLLLVEAQEEKSVEALPLFEEEERGDPSVLTRKQIKAMSEKIVEERSKQEQEQT